jgi:hypothetical protein
MAWRKAVVAWPWEGAHDGAVNTEGEEDGTWLAPMMRGGSGGAQLGCGVVANMVAR